MAALPFVGATHWDICHRHIFMQRVAQCGRLTAEAAHECLVQCPSLRSGDQKQTQTIKAALYAKVRKKNGSSGQCRICLCCAGSHPLPVSKVFRYSRIAFMIEECNMPSYDSQFRNFLKHTCVHCPPPTTHHAMVRHKLAPAFQYFSTGHSTAAASVASGQWSGKRSSPSRTCGVG